MLKRQEQKNSTNKFEKLVGMLVQEQKMFTNNKNGYSEDAIVNTITEFHYLPEKELTFSSNFRRYEDLYKTDCANGFDDKTVRLLLTKLGTVGHTKFVIYIYYQIRLVT